MDSAFPVVGAKTYVLGWGDTDPGKFLSCTDIRALLTVNAQNLGHQLI